MLLVWCCGGVFRPIKISRFRFRTKWKTNIKENVSVSGSLSIWVFSFFYFSFFPSVVFALQLWSFHLTCLRIGILFLFLSTFCTITQTNQLVGSYIVQNVYFGFLSISYQLFLIVPCSSLLSSIVPTNCLYLFPFFSWGFLSNVL